MSRLSLRTLSPIALLVALAGCGGSSAPPCSTPLATCGGSCTDTQTDPANCGACGTACTSGQSCMAGKCQTGCPGGSLLCGAICVDVASDDQNCGSCGNACPAGEACSLGSCTATCAPGYTACTSGGEVGKAVCADLQDDPANCGACGTACPTGQLCQAGACVASCTAGRTVCSVTGGGATCADLTSDPANCGKCGTACAAGQACVSGACSCPVPTPDACGSGSSAFCTSLASDPASCGACGKPCTSGQLCERGACTASCTTGFSACPRPGPASYCADLSTDVANCGACGNACVAGESCTGGTCSARCATGLTACNSSCVDLSSSRDHCGACTIVCDAGQSCVGGSCVGPIAYWPFEGTSDDLTGDGNNGTVNGFTPYVLGYAGEALRFDGVTSWVEVAAPRNLPIGAAPRTIEAWVNPGTLADATHNGLVAWGGTSGTCGDPGQLLAMTSSYLLSSANGCNYLSEAISGTPGLKGAWSHASYTFDGTTRQLYLNGQLVASDTPGAFSTGSGPLAIGSADLPGRLFTGILDEVKIYDYARSAADLLYDATAVAHYRFDDVDLGRDSGPNHLEGAATGATPVAGRIGQALMLTGGTCVTGSTSTCSYFSAPDLTALGVTGQPFTIELWVNPASNAGTIIQLATSADGAGWCTPFLGFSKPLPTPLLVAQVFDGTKNDVATDPTPLTAGVWTHVAESWSSADGLRLYVNGAQVATNVAATTSVMSGQPDYLFAGGTGSSGTTCSSSSIQTSPFQGGIDDVKVFARELSPSEIAAEATP